MKTELPTNLADAKTELRGYGMTVNRTEAGDLRVDFAAGTKGHVRGPEGSAYHTDDLRDAVGTAREMRDHRDRQPNATNNLRAAAAASRANVEDRNTPRSREAAESRPSLSR